MIKGAIKKIIFSSLDGFTVGLIKINETDEEDLKDYKNKLFTFTGLFAELKLDENYKFYGNIVDNPKYGFQYKVDKYEIVMPDDKDGLILFLSSDIFPKVGEKTAQQIVDILGNDCLKMIANDYTCLLNVPKMTEKKAISIKENLNKYNESFETVVFLTNFGFNMKDSLKIYNYYLENTIKVVSNNPYELIDTIDSVTFLKIDELRHKTNILENDERRILALIIYVMQTLCFKLGDTYLNEEIIRNTCNSLVDDKLSLEELSYYLIELNSMGKIIIEDDKYILANYYKDELYISEIAYSLSNMPDNNVKDIDLKIERLEIFFDINYNDEQKRAIKKAIIKNFSIITGGPGTGKTTIIKGIVQLYKNITGYSFDKLKEKMVLLAPTGRAAKRMSDSCLYPASTIHRYLKWNKETEEFLVNEKNKSNAEFVIVDESSMIDVSLMANLFKALKSNVKLLLIGDYNQLESVSPGNILKDLIDSEIINTIFLKEIYRTDQNSYITELAYEVNNSNLSESFTSKKDDYNFIECSEIDVLEACVKVAKKAIDKGYDIKNVQVLAPIYKGICGIDNLNKALQNVFNPKSDLKDEVYDGDFIYRVGDKILQLENMPDDNVFNGDIGFIEKISGGEITINFDGNVVKYTKKDYKAIKHGYAISIHKAQGSEFQIVIMPIVNSYKMMLYKKLVYTGITRAKKSLILIGEANAFMKAVYNRLARDRKTLLKNLLINKIN